MTSTLVDSHCHLNLLEFERLGGDLENALATARDNGVDYMLCVSIDLETNPEILAIATDHDTIFASVGVHPNSRECAEPTVDGLVERASDRNVIAIGETGLDYFRGEGNLEWQRERFRVHIAAAKQTSKPLIVHCRDARDDTLRILKEEGADQVGGVMHCFVEDWATAAKAMDLNFYISFSGIVTFKSAQTLHQVAAAMPADKILIETDSPYLAPVPHRGRTNQPAYVKHVAEHIATLRNESFETVAETTTANFFSLFKDASR